MFKGQFIQMNNLRLIIPLRYMQKLTGRYILEMLHGLAPGPFYFDIVN
jgi:hypothetical protein